MTQNYMLHHILGTPHELFGKSRTHDALVHYMDRQGIESVQDVDMWFDDAVENLFVTSESNGISRSLFSPIYIESKTYEASQTLDESVDALIVDHLKSYHACSNGIVYSRIVLDFFNMKSLHYGVDLQELRAFGNMDKTLFEMHGDNIKGLLHNSEYYTWNLSDDDYALDDILNKVLDERILPGIHDGNSDNGLFSKMYARVQELKTIRSAMKAYLFGLDNEGDDGLWVK